MRPPRLRPVEAEDPPSGAGSGGGNGNGGLTRYRLDQLESRLTGVECKVDQLISTCTKIETRMDESASKSCVLRLFGATVAVLVLSLAGHLLILTLRST